MLGRSPAGLQERQQLGQAGKRLTELVWQSSSTATSAGCASRATGQTRKM